MGLNSQSLLLVAALCLSGLATATNKSARQNSPDYYDPTAQGGSMLTMADGTCQSNRKLHLPTADEDEQLWAKSVQCLQQFPLRLTPAAQPLNIIISGQSDSSVLNENLQYYFASLGFSINCLGSAAPTQQRANLGDGHGGINETAVYRENYGDFNVGACRQTVLGGNHFRYWVQNGAQANSGAVFLAASYEGPLSGGHYIVSNGYDLGRDLVLGNATRSGGQTAFNGLGFTTQSTNVTGLLQAGTHNINHNIAIDGIVYLFHVTSNVTSSSATSDNSKSSSARLHQISRWLLVACALGLWTAVAT